MAAQTVLLPDGTRADRPRSEPRVRIRVRARLDTVLPGGHSVRRGTEPHTGRPLEHPQVNEVVVYRSDLPAIKEMVEELSDKLEFAKEAAETQYKQWIIRKLNDKAWEADQRGEPNTMYNRDTWGGSVEKCFFEAVGVRRSTVRPGVVFSGIKPLISVETVEDLPPPEIPAPVTGDGSRLGVVGDDLQAYIDQQVQKGIKEALGKQRK